MTSRNVNVDPKELAVCVFLLFAVLFVFGQTVRHDFINLDDDDYVFANKHVFYGLTPSSVQWAFTDGKHATWIPLTWLSLMLDVEFYDLHAGGFHLTNVLLHAVSAMLLFLVLRRMTDRFWPSVFVAAIFAIHPLRVESVTWVTERKDVLSGLFFILTLWAYLAYTRKRSLARYGLVVLLYMMGLMAKPMLVTLPLILLLLDYWPLDRVAFPKWMGGRNASAIGGENPLQSTAVNRLSLWTLILEKIPLMGVAFGDSLITMLIQGKCLVTTERLPWLWRVETAVINYVLYLKKLFYPIGLAVVYPRDDNNPALWMVLAALALLAAISVAVFLVRRKHPYWLVGWLWYLIMMVPVIGLVQFGLTSVADRFTYLPHIGLICALTWGIADWCGQHSYRRAACGAAATVVLVASASYSCWLASFWCDSETLWNRAIACTTGNYAAHNNLGIILAHEGRFEEAIDHFEKAMKITPHVAMAYSNYGSAMFEAGQLDNAQVLFQKAVDLDPNYVDALNKLAMMEARCGNAEKAISHFEKSLDVEPNSAETHYDLAVLLKKNGRREEAAKHFQRGAELDPQYAQGHNKLGMICAQRNLFVEACEHFRRALDADPHFSEARQNLAELLAEKGFLKESLCQYETLLKMDPGNQEAKNAMARLLAKSTPAPLPPPKSHTKDNF